MPSSLPQRDRCSFSSPTVMTCGTSPLPPKIRQPTVCFFLVGVVTLALTLPGQSQSTAREGQNPRTSLTIYVGIQSLCGPRHLLMTLLHVFNWIQTNFPRWPEKPAFFRSQPSSVLQMSHPSRMTSMTSLKLNSADHVRKLLCIISSTNLSHCWFSGSADKNLLNDAGSLLCLCGLHVLLWEPWRAGGKNAFFSWEATGSGTCHLQDMMKWNSHANPFGIRLLASSPALRLTSLLISRLLSFLRPSTCL